MEGRGGEREGVRGRSGGDRREGVGGVEVTGEESERREGVGKW